MAAASMQATACQTCRCGAVYMWAYTQRERVLSPAFIAREHLLSPDQYELVDVRTRSGVRRAFSLKSPCHSLWHIQFYLHVQQ
jgi:hypothetical protein